MTSKTIYLILSSKPHNKHYLTRYVKFVQHCEQKNKNSTELYFEQHHICPKAADLFPEYTCVKTYKWNAVNLTTRQHFIAHWLLWKCFGGSQTYAFKAMCDGQKNRHQSQRTHQINSKTYQTLKESHKQHLSKQRKNKATYIDCSGKSVYCEVTDFRVVSGELISATKGRKHKNKSEETKKLIRDRLIEQRWKKYPIRSVNLYFLDMKIEVQYTRNDFIFLEYIEQGWSLSCTPEYRSMLSIRSNKNRTKRKSVSG